MIHDNSLSHYNSHRRVGFHHLSARCRSLSPRLEHARAPDSRAQGISIPDKCHWSQVLRKRRHLMSSTTKHGHRRPHALKPHPITTWHSNSTTGTCIIDMITQTLDKFALVKEGFSMRNPVHQGLGWSTPRQMAHPRGLCTPRKGSLESCYPM
jgi:hypothetical protein